MLKYIFFHKMKLSVNYKTYAININYTTITRKPAKYLEVK